DMLNHKMAALRKFQERELDDTQKIQVDLDLLKTVNAYENPQQTPWLPSTVEIVTRVANEFIQRHSDEPEPASQASYVQIRAEALGRDPSSITDGDLTEDIERLTAIHDKYPGTAGALFALMDVLEMIKDRDGLGSEAMATMVQKLKSGYADHPGLRQMAYKLQPYVLAVEGLPEFTVTDLSGKEWNSRNLGGGVILFDFWATWCAPCLQELPNLIQLYSMYKDRGFQILGISLDEQQKISEDDLKKWIKENNITWPIVYSGQGWSTTGVHECGATAGIPFPILVGRDGKVITAAEGATGQNLAKELAKLFGES
ncbi:MAG: TlpA family protein disulfide reductase, partial [Candidatus Eisenbacteria sp.]|nr:TlpA family protein disulfide reductase [Candidatus Eisenbacteria bacterium]